MPIVYRELFALVLAINTFGKSLYGKRVLYHIDNQAVVFALNNGYSKNSEMMVLIRKLYFIMAFYSIECKAVFISTHLNSSADALSRGDMDKFHKLNPTAEPTLTWPETIELEGDIYY